MENLAAWKIRKSFHTQPYVHKIQVLLGESATSQRVEAEDEQRKQRAPLQQLFLQNSDGFCKRRGWSWNRVTALLPLFPFLLSFFPYSQCFINWHLLADSPISRAILYLQNFAGSFWMSLTEKPKQKALFLQVSLCRTGQCEEA